MGKWEILIQIFLDGKRVFRGGHFRSPTLHSNEHLSLGQSFLHKLAIGEESLRKNDR